MKNKCDRIFGERHLRFAVVAVLIFCLISSFTSCDVIINKLNSNEYVNNQSPVDAGSENNESEDTELPQYIKDLITLDELFTKLSYDGIDEELIREAILDAYISATGDIYAEYLNAEEYESYFTEQKGEFVGIGVSIVNSKITVNGRDYVVMEIISVFNDSPALEGGIQAGDCIMYIEYDGKDTLVDAMGYTRALDAMLGESGSEAVFTVFRPTEDGYREIDFKIPRRKVEKESVTYKVSTTDSRVGIVNITGFDLTTPTQFKEAVNTLRDVHGCEYFVFDVRNNPGGVLDSIEAVLSYFLKEGDLIVSTEYSDGSGKASYAEAKKYEEPYSGYDVAAEEIGMYSELDCVVITNENTASAAELFTATLRDYDIAEIVGMKTYGKGCMQTLYPLSSYGLDGGLKLTVAMYFSASKTVYHGEGIKPDHEQELSEEAKNINFFLLSEEMDAQLLKAVEVVTK